MKFGFVVPYATAQEFLELAVEIEQAGWDAAFGWEITGKFISRTPAEVIVQLDWRRAWEQGRPANAPSCSCGTR